MHIKTVLFLDPLGSVAFGLPGSGSVKFFHISGSGFSSEYHVNKFKIKSLPCVCFLHMATSGIFFAFLRTFYPKYDVGKNCSCYLSDPNTDIKKPKSVKSIAIPLSYSFSFGVAER